MLVAIEIDGVRLEVPSTSELTLGEWKRVKDETGMTISEFEDALARTDPHAWGRLLEIAARNVDTDPAIVDNANLLDILKAIQAQVDAEDAEGEGEGGDEPPSPETTRARSGTRSSPASSQSTPGT